MGPGSSPGHWVYVRARAAREQRGDSARMLDRRAFFIGSGALGLAGPAFAQAAVRSRRVFYKNGGLNLAAYLSQPAGPGPFPLVIFNHGSRAGHERESFFSAYNVSLYLSAGYALLVPERRGYGQSDGDTFAEAVG